MHSAAGLRECVRAWFKCVSGVWGRERATRDVRAEVPCSSSATSVRGSTPAERFTKIYSGKGEALRLGRDWSWNGKLTSPCAPPSCSSRPRGQHRARVSYAGGTGTAALQNTRLSGGICIGAGRTNAS
mgnify:FL=1